MAARRRNGRATPAAQTASHRRATHQLHDASYQTDHPPTFEGNLMKTVTLLAALLVSSGVFANDIDPNGFEKQHFASSASRAEVIADLKVAQQQGQLPVGELGVKVIETPSTKSRAQVVAELLQS